MKKIIEKNPIKAQKIALIILVTVFGLSAFLALLSYPLIGWFCLALTCFSIYLITTSVKIQALEKKRLEAEAIDFINRMRSPAETSEVSDEEEN